MAGCNLGNGRELVAGVGRQSRREDARPAGRNIFLRYVHHGSAHSARAPDSGPTRDAFTDGFELQGLSGGIARHTVRPSRYRIIDLGYSTRQRRLVEQDEKLDCGSVIPRKCTRCMRRILYSCRSHEPSCVVAATASASAIVGAPPSSLLAYFIFLADPFRALCHSTCRQREKS